MVKIKRKVELESELMEIHKRLAELGIAEAEHKRIEEVLKASELRYRRLFETAEDGILILDGDTGQIDDVNPCLMDMLQYSHEEFVGKYIWEIGLFKNTKLSRDAFEKLKRKGYIRYEDLPLETRAGKHIDVEFVCNVYKVNGKNVIQCNIRDVTEHKKDREALNERTLELEKLNNELESFSYSVSHDLRAPLRAIDGYTRMIINKYGYQFNEDILAKFDVIRNSVHMMAQLIDDLLAFSHLGRKNMSMSKIDMETLIRDVWEVLQAINPGRNINLTVNNIPPGYGDRTLIKQVYVNLFSNAIKFSKFRDPAFIEVGGHVDGNKDVYYVKDNGVGFDMQYYDKLFGVFQRLHRVDEFEGSGIGLATVQRIINRHEGLVWAEGKVGEGATFYFSLPSSHSHTR